MSDMSNKTMNKEVVEYVESILDDIEFDESIKDKSRFFKISLIYRILKKKSTSKKTKNIEIKSIKSDYGEYIVNHGEYVLKPINSDTRFWIYYLRYISKIDKDNYKVLMSMRNLILDMRKSKKSDEEIKDIIFNKLMKFDIDMTIERYNFPIKKIYRDKMDIVESMYNKSMKNINSKDSKYIREK